MKTYKLCTVLGTIAEFSADSVEDTKALAMKFIKTTYIKQSDIFLKEEDSYIEYHREKYGVSKKGTTTWTHWKTVDVR